jgi:hypothetical protein
MPRVKKWGWGAALIGREKGKGCRVWVGYTGTGTGKDKEEREDDQGWCNGSEMEAIELEKKEG